MKNQRGITLIELIIVVAILGVLITTVALTSTSYLKRQSLSASSREVLSDLQKLRMEALTRGSSGNNRGFGIRFASNTEYFTFEFNDANNNFVYNGTSEELNARGKSLPTNVTIKRWDGSSLVSPSSSDADVLLFDKRGLLRDNNLSAILGNSFVLELPGVSPPRCVVLSPVRIREGVWNGTACDET